MNHFEFEELFFSFDVQMLKKLSVGLYYATMFHLLLINIDLLLPLTLNLTLKVTPSGKSGAKCLFTSLKRGKGKNDKFVALCYRFDSAAEAVSSHPECRLILRGLIRKGGGIQMTPPPHSSTWLVRAFFGLSSAPSV